MEEATLRSEAERCGILIGAACNPKLLAVEARYREMLAREFNCVVAENCMKFSNLQPERGRFTFADGDAVAAFAREHGMRLRGHTLVWHNQLSDWVSEGTFSKHEAMEILRTHIFTVLEHFRGKAYCWDVVNEGLGEDGGWREKSPWFRLIGPDYLAQVFRWAHEADPTIQLIYNDYGMELPGPKSDGCYRMVRELLDQGVPIHGVGFQYHLGVENKLDPAACLANFKRFSALGLDIQLTELDMGIKKPITDALRREQADEYANRFRIAVDSGAVSAMIFWGFTDRYTWVPGFTKGEYDEPLPFDREYQPKPAYFAIRDTLAACGDTLKIKKGATKEMKSIDVLAAERIERMKWWTDARFGMFIHWGLYAQLGRGEWVMNRERIPIPEYEKLANTWKPKAGFAREWAQLAKKAGMKYMVLTTKHHEGFCLWDSKVTDYCATRRGPKRDLVREYVKACREAGLKVGFYYSLMDWHHPDGHACVRDENARRRFVDYTTGLVRELMTQYGKIDILWYDVSYPLQGADKWESDKINAMARKLQPHILINDRSQLPEDFGTPEEHITALSGENGRGWEACMTFNGSWGWQDAPPEDWHSVRKVLDMLRTCAAGSGNLLLNIGPLPDGSVPRLAVERLTKVGQWLKTYGGAIYGAVDRVENMEFSNTCTWSRKGKTIFSWVTRWPGETFVIGGVRGKLKKATLFATGKALPFTQEKDRVILKGLPKACPDKIAGVSLIELDFAQVPYQQLGCGYEYLKPVYEVGKNHSPFAVKWRMSSLQKIDKNGIAAAPYVKPKADWPLITGNAQSFIQVHDKFSDRDGVVYLANRFRVRQAGPWVVRLGHDGGAKLFVDGKEALCVPESANPAEPWRSQVNVTLSKGEHEVVVALDTNQGLGWGIFFRWEQPKRSGKGVPCFPLECS